MKVSAADGGEALAGGRRRLANFVVAPADRGAVGAECAGVPTPAADGGERLVRGRRRLADVLKQGLIGSPAYGRSVDS